MNNFFSFGSAAEILVYMSDEKDRKQVTIKSKNDRYESLPLYFDGEDINGKVVVRVKDGKKIEHNGITIQFVGCIDYLYDKNHPYIFLELSDELASAGELKHTQSYDFRFPSVEKPFESYFGYNVCLRYYLKVIMKRKMTDLVKEKELIVYTFREPADVPGSIKMEVGIEDCLHIEFEYNKSKYHMMDVIVGKISFILVRIKIKHMEISIIRRETTGAAPNQYSENETLTRYEIMDGAPGKGECIPIRLFLNGFDLTPTFKDITRHAFSVRYFLNLVLVDEESRRYFKQQEITIFRSKEDEDSLNDRVKNSKTLCLNE